MAKYNVPKSCPVKEVSIITHNPVFSLNWCDHFLILLFVYLSVNISVNTINTKQVHDWRTN
jgi:hypothetical protein